MPSCLAFSSAAFTSTRGRLVHVRCIMISPLHICCPLPLISSVRSAVEPPAPHVKSMNSGSSCDMRSSRSYKFSTPSRVLGGKYSNE